MTVEQVVDKCRKSVKEHNRKSVTSIEYIPDIVPAPRVGKRYTVTTGLNGSIPEYLKGVECTKYFIESDCAVVIFKHTDELIQEIEHVEVY